MARSNEEKASVTPEMTYINILRVQPSAVINPRRHFQPEALDELVDSIKRVGVLQPILVRPLEADEGKGPLFEIVAGERRWRAATTAGLKEIPARVVDMDDEHAIEAAAIENLHREDIHELEEAYGFKALMDAASLSAEAVAERIGKSARYVWARLELLRLEPEIQKVFLEEDTISASQAVLIARLDRPGQIKATQAVVNKALSVRGLESWLDKQGERPKADKPASEPEAKKPGAFEKLQVAAMLMAYSVVRLGIVEGYQRATKQLASATTDTLADVLTKGSYSLDRLAGFDLVAALESVGPAKASSKAAHAAAPITAEDAPVPAEPAEPNATGSKEGEAEAPPMAEAKPSKPAKQAKAKEIAAEGYMTYVQPSGKVLAVFNAGKLDCWAYSEEPQEGFTLVKLPGFTRDVYGKVVFTAKARNTDDAWAKADAWDEEASKAQEPVQASAPAAEAVPAIPAAESTVVEPPAVPEVVQIAHEALGVPDEGWYGMLTRNAETGAAYVGLWLDGKTVGEMAYTPEELAAFEDDQEIVEHAIEAAKEQVQPAAPAPGDLPKFTHTPGYNDKLDHLRIWFADGPRDFYPETFEVAEKGIEYFVREAVAETLLDDEEGEDDE